MMDPQIIKALTAERKELQKKLKEAEALQRRLRAVESLLAAYGVEMANGKETSKIEGGQGSEKGKKVLSKYTATEALNIIRDYIKGKQHPTPTKELLHLIQSHGFIVRGKNPVTNLSAVLSRSPQFQSLGRSGWVYTGEEEVDGPTVAVDPDAVTEDTSVSRPNSPVRTSKPSWL